MKKQQMISRSGNLNILLAEDDIDDCQFFKEALKELPISTQLNIVHDGEKLLHFLKEITGELPHILFLDLNMPRKNGFECLKEIKKSPVLNTLPVIILSTSYNNEIAELLYTNGAMYYICKPNSFSGLKKVIHHVLTRIENEGITRSPKEKFLIQI